MCITCTFQIIYWFFFIKKINSIFILLSFNGSKTIYNYDDPWYNLVVSLLNGIAEFDDVPLPPVGPNAITFGVSCSWDLGCDVRIFGDVSDWLLMSSLKK